MNTTLEYFSKSETAEIINKIELQLSSPAARGQVGFEAVSSEDICKAIPYVIMILEAIGTALGPMGKLVIGGVVSLVKEWSKKHCK